MAMADLPVRVRMPCPVLVRVTGCGVLEDPTPTGPNERLRGESETIGGAVPVPVRFTVCGLLLSPSVRVTVPLMVATKAGLKVTETVQDFPAAREDPQVL